MSTKHTPGPWHVGMKQAHRIIYDPTGWAVADATVYHGKESQNEMMANARLIAAAPDAVQLLRDVVAMLNDPDADQFTAQAMEARIAELLGKVDA